MARALLILFAAATAMAEPAGVAQKLLEEKCAKCHGAATKLSDFDVTTRESALKGGKYGPAIKAGDASASRLYQWIAEGKMPPGEKLDAATLEAVKDWINAGAPWSVRTTKDSHVYWAFQPPVKVSPPDSKALPIDAFILTRLREKGLDFNAKADPRTLIRRLYFDLTGLPPGPADYAQSYEEAVERLLRSPQYGERWGRHWLDIVRFGETDGGEHNNERMNAWPYRDWVIRSLNEDKPYPQFIREQIAGDVLAPEDPKMVAATGFLVAGPWDSVSAVLNKDDTLREQARMDELDDMVTTTAHSFLALTVNCARCHDHKFDPIPTRDYYRMTAFFRGAGFGEREVGPQAERRAREEYLKPLTRAAADLRKQLAEIEDPVKARLLTAKYQELDRERAGESRRLPVNPFWNRNSFAEVKATKFRFVMSGGRKGQALKADYLELLPAGHRVTNLEGDTPIDIEFDTPKSVSEIRFAGTLTVYRLEALTEGEWRVLCSSLDHVGLAELGLPAVSDAEVEGELAPESRQAREALQKQLSELQRQMNEGPKVTKLYAAAPKDLEKAWLLERGNVKRRVEELTPGILTAIGGDLDPNRLDSGGSRRLALANWIASEKNPLTARVIVNRIWYYHFGNGIVNTPSDFGVNGDRPSHPELLDWLAVSFMENGWSMKWLHRQILATRTYQQSAAINEKAFAVDAGNRLLWRMPLKRMDAETLRDSVLSVTGNLNLQANGPGFLLQKNAARGSYIYKVLDNDGPEVWRRAVYRFVVRGGERIMLDSFDCPDPSVATPQRAVSNTPVQALTLLNNQFIIRQAGLLAARLDREAASSREAQVDLAYRLLYGRSPTTKELERDLRFLKTQTMAAWCRVLLNSNEFVYVP